MFAIIIGLSAQIRKLITINIFTSSLSGSFIRYDLLPPGGKTVYIFSGKNIILYTFNNLTTFPHMCLSYQLAL